MANGTAGCAADFLDTTGVACGGAKRENNNGVGLIIGDSNLKRGKGTAGGAAQISDQPRGSLKEVVI